MVKSIAMNREKPHLQKSTGMAQAETDRKPVSGWSTKQLQDMKSDIIRWGMELGFQQLGVADTRLEEHEQHLLAWLDQGMHGQMSYMQRHGTRRSRPAELLPGTLRVISARMDYLSEQAQDAKQLLEQPEQALISRYALGRDYHKLLRQRLQKLARRIEQHFGSSGYRVFVDSAPVLEKALAAQAGLGWIGKHSNLLNKTAGSWFFLGEIYTDLPLPLDQPVANHCGSCSRCIDICPTQAIIAPYRVDARRCVSYLTIELRESIPVELRPLMGNRIFGCDDCQFVCPWNRYAQFSQEDDFSPRPGLDAAQLLELFSWTEEEFQRRTEGSAIRRIGYPCWLRNVAVALGNAPSSAAIMAGLHTRIEYADEMVREHVLWALQQQAGAS